MNHLCPFCGSKVVRQCRCMRSDKTCEKGHHWHRCTVHKTIVAEESDHSISTMNCTCKPGKTYKECLLPVPEEKDCQDGWAKMCEFLIGGGYGIGKEKIGGISDGNYVSFYERFKEIQP